MIDRMPSRLVGRRALAVVDGEHYPDVARVVFTVILVWLSCREL